MNGGLFNQANSAVIQTELASIKDQIEIYRADKHLESIAENKNIAGIDLYPITNPKETMATIDPNTLSENLKSQLLLLANTAGAGNVPTFNNIDYSQFYKIDDQEIKYNERTFGTLYIWTNEEGNEYKVISIKGMKNNATTAHIIIPMDKLAEPQYVVTSNNTYKLYGDGRLAVLGQLNSLSGATAEEINAYSGVREFIMPSVIPQYTSADHPINTEEDKVKKLYFSSGTAYVIDKNNDLWAWGNNSGNKLGLGNSYPVNTPTKIARQCSKCVGW